MNKFAVINYGNDWGIFVDIENDNCNNVDCAIFINDYENAESEHEYKYQNNCAKIVNTIYINLFVCGFLAYIVYFVL
jgi:hypothetical protein